MKTFTSFVKRSLAVVLAVLGMASPARAQLESISDLFGKYKFSAKVEYTPAGKNYQGVYKENAEVTIGADPKMVYNGVINGLLGVEGACLTINALSQSGDSLIILNPNFGNPWGELISASAKGENPYVMPMYDTKYVYHADDRSIEIPDFTLGKCSGPNSPFEVMVKVSQAKLELIELDDFKVADLTGDWHFKAGQGSLADPNSVIPCEFDLKLKNSGDNKKYEATVAFEGLDPVTLPAVFNGIDLSISIDNTKVVEAKDSAIIFLISVNRKMYRTGDIVFRKVSDDALSLSTIIKFGVISLPDGASKSICQILDLGMAKREGGSAVTKSWEGTYTFKSGKFMNPLPEYGMKDEFTMVVEPNTALGGYGITEMMGEKLLQGGIRLEESVDNPNVLTMPEGLKYLKMLEPGKSYLILTDMNAQDGALQLVRKADGSFTLPSFGVMLYDFESKERKLVAYYQEVTGTNGAEEVETFTWDGSYLFHSGNFMNPLPDYGMKQDFNMVVVPNPALGGYCISEMMGENTLNLGGIRLDESADDPNVLTMPEGMKYLKMLEPGKSYLILTDVNGQDGALQLVRKADGSFTLPSFAVMLYDFESKARKLVAYYQEVTGQKKAVEPKPAFSWAKTYTLTADVQVYDDSYAYPTSFDMTVTFDADTQTYGVTHFLNNDIVALNYGAAAFTVSADDPMQASLVSGIFVGSVKLGELYLSLADLNGQNSPIHFTSDADGNLTVDNFSIMLKSFPSGELRAGASYRNVKGHVSTTAVGKLTVAPARISVVGGTVLLGEVQPVAVYDLAGKCVFHGTTNRVEGLQKGLYVVKTAAAAAKVVVR